MEIRLTILNKKEIECFMNGTMPTIIPKTTLFKLHFYRIVFCTIGTMSNPTHATSKLVQVPTKYLTGKAYLENPFSHF